MTFTYFMRGLWVRAWKPFHRFYVETVRLGYVIPALSLEHIRELRADKEAATAARAERIAVRLPSEHSVKPPKGAEVIVVDPPALLGDFNDTIERLKRGA